MVIQHSLSTARLAADEAAWLWPTMHVVSRNVQADYFEAALTRAGFLVEQTIDVGSEWREYREETTGQSRLLHAARLMREPARYITRFGQEAYDVMLGDCYWHVYQMLGKFSNRIYVLRLEAM